MKKTNTWWKSTSNLYGQRTGDIKTISFVQLSRRKQWGDTHELCSTKKGMKVLKSVQDVGDYTIKTHVFNRSLRRQVG